MTQTPDRRAQWRTWDEIADIFQTPAAPDWRPQAIDVSEVPRDPWEPDPERPTVD